MECIDRHSWNDEAVFDLALNRQLRVWPANAACTWQGQRAVTEVWFSLREKEWSPNSARKPKDAQTARFLHLIFQNLWVLWIVAFRVRIFFERELCRFGFMVLKPLCFSIQGNKFNERMEAILNYHYEIWPGVHPQMLTSSKARGEQVNAAWILVYALKKNNGTSHFGKHDFGRVCK